MILWGNGTGTVPFMYAAGLARLASHGFIVGAANTSNAGTGVAMLTCLDWILEQNAAAGSAYEGHVDTERVGATGHSQGGGGSIMAGADPRVTVTAPLAPYVRGLGHNASSQSDQGGPMLLLSGTLDTFAPPTTNQSMVFENVNVPTFWANRVGADHVASMMSSFTVYSAPMVAWFRFHMMGDTAAKAMFYGEACGLCGDSAWIVDKKDLQ